MTMTEERSKTVVRVPARAIDMKLEIVVIPVSDVDRAKAFYASLGWRLDADFTADDDYRVIQFTPPGSGCSVIFGKNVTAAAPGSAQGLYLIVSDIDAARNDLVRRGVQVSDAFHGAADAYAGTDEPYLFGRIRLHGPDPKHNSYRSFASFNDPDGNGWLFQEITERLPGRVEGDTTFDFVDGSCERTPACGGRAWRAREAFRWPTRCELAGLVRRIHGPRASGQASAFIKSRIQLSRERST